MDPAVIERLTALNHEFYQTFAEHFADKRTRLQPGVVHTLQSTPPSANLLDLGCGHGSFAEELLIGGHQATYLGLDSSEPMISLARNRVSHDRVQFLLADLNSSSWQDSLSAVEDRFHPPYACVFAFASLHHIPGSARRAALVKEVFAMMPVGGLWTVSVWDFLQSDRLRSRVQPWTTIGIDPDQVEQGDFLLDWRHGGRGIRYVHHFTPDSLEALARQGGAKVIQHFRMDGEKGKLGLYQVWEKV